MKIRERDEARTLRREQGQSIKEIARAVGVSKSSVSRWVHDIELTEDQLLALAARNPILNAQMNGARARMARARADRLRAQEEGRVAARMGDPFHAAACMLYWGEGSKSRNDVQLSNSDPAMVAFFLRFLRAYFAVPDSRVRIQCNLHADDSQHVRETEDHWLHQLGLERESLSKSIVNSVSGASLHKRRNMLPYGTCRLSVHSTAIVQHIYGAIQEYGASTARRGSTAPPAHEVYGRMAAERNHFNINLGDTIYSDSEVGGVPPALTIPAKWAKYRQNLGYAHLRNLRTRAS